MVSVGSAVGISVGSIVGSMDGISVGSIVDWEFVVEASINNNNDVAMMALLVLEQKYKNYKTAQHKNKNIFHLNLNLNL